jgi:hypothetical protein
MLSLASADDYMMLLGVVDAGVSPTAPETRNTQQYLCLFVFNSILEVSVAARV